MAVVRAAFALLRPADQRKYWLVVGAQMATSVLDLVGVLLIGCVGIFAAAGIGDAPLPEWLQQLVNGLGLEDLSPASLAGVAAAAAAILLIGKGAISVVLIRRIFRFLGSRQAEVSTRLTAQLFSQPLAFVERRPSQEVSFVLSRAVVGIITVTLGSFSILLSEIALLTMLGVALFVIDPAVTLVAMLFFTAVGVGLQRGLRSWASRIGDEIATTAILGQQRVQEGLASYRELMVMGRRHLVVQNVAELWRRGGIAQGDSLYIVQLPKIGYETALVLGALGLAAWQFATGTSMEAVAILALFLGAGSRVLPSMLRLNTLLLGIRSGAASAKALFPMVSQLNSAPVVLVTESEPAHMRTLAAAGFPGFEPRIEVSDVSVTYEGSDRPALSGISLTVEPRTSIALVGTTGAGKSTLADVMLGVLSPDNGEVLVSGVRAHEAISRWPGALAYVPQKMVLINGTVRDNVALGIPTSEVDDELVWRALGQAHLDEFLTMNREGLETHVGERGVRLSGGQQQRLSLARALYSRPQLLVLDEATSALDAETEHLVGDALAALSASITIVTIAHRLATIREADTVVYLEHGRIAALGTFDEVRRESAGFGRQASLLGL
jgi:ATP-binding cassette subfamily C protein